MRRARPDLLRRFRGDRAGGAAVEFAVAAPVLAILIFGLFEIGLAFHSGAAVRNAVQRASRTLLITPSASGESLRTAVLDMLPGVPTQNLAITVTAESQGGVPTRRVEWTYGYPVAIPFLPTRTWVFDSSLIVPVAIG